MCMSHSAKIFHFYLLDNHFESTAVTLLNDIIMTVRIQETKMEYFSVIAHIHKINVAIIKLEIRKIRRYEPKTLRKIIII